jgi:prepilin-type processing-associated H-X9-DG protein
METTMRRDKGHGFTIIEMLVVIAVVMVLMVLLLWPCVNRARPAARKSYCLSNLKQIGLAAAIYAQDYDETLFWNPAPGGLPATHWGPTHRPEACAAQPSTSFVALLYPYIKNSGVFRCPEYPGYAMRRHLGYRESVAALSGLPNDAAGASGSPDRTHKIGYGFNELLGSPCRPRTVASLKRLAAEVALLADAEEPWASSESWAKRDGKWGRYWSADVNRELRHETGQNFAYVDGHAKFLIPVRTEAKTREPGRGYYPGARME